MSLQIELGQDVIASDGEKVGSVDRLVLNPETHAIEQFIVHSGFFTREDKLIEAGLVSSADQNGVRLNVSSDEVHAFPTFVEEHYAAVSADQLTGGGIIIPNAGGVGQLLYDAPRTGRGYPGTGSYFDPAPIDPPPLEPASNVPETDAIISEGTDVIGSNGDKLGTVGEVTVGPNGQLEAFIVKAGLLFKHDVRVSADQIAAIGSDHVRLTITADEAERRG
jgi:uncharacterized protein YrrD